jgi:2-keto-4-pentenoate hydratase/2-oxohepta-3-ene-1,7-dioic acid hydratase in catechol pathway
MEQSLDYLILVVLNYEIMKIIRYKTGEMTEYGLLKGDSVQAIRGTPFRRLETTGATYKLSEVKLLPPCVPSKIAALGLNYQEHAQELKMNTTAAPLVFLKPPTAIIGPEDNIIYPMSSKQVDYEGELGVVIKKRTRHVTESEALDYVLGYTCVNDVTARDIQSIDVQWTRAKSFDTFCPIGPCIETDLNPDNAQIETYLNGELKQKGNTKHLIHHVRKLICFISDFMTLLPGDVISTGTPSGIGPMKRGDTVEVRIQGIGTLRNHVL